MLGRYEVVHPLERGPEVRVYLARDRFDGNLQRVLTLLPKRCASSSSLDEVSRSLSLRRSLQCPGLVCIHDVGFRGRRPGLVSEFISVPRLFSSLNGVGREVRCQIASRLCELVSHLHARRFFLGALSPGQLFWAPQASLTLNVLYPRYFRDAVPGTLPQYYSPENQCGGTLNAKSDLYSLGMVLYHLFTGQRPFAGVAPKSLRATQMAAYPLRPRRLDPDMPRVLEELIMDLIQKDPDLRPDSVEYACRLLNSDSVPSPCPDRFRAPLIGRDAELETFRNLLGGYSEDRKGLFLAVGGPNGVGKTRLLKEFETDAKLQGVVTLWAGSSAGYSAGLQELAKTLRAFLGECRSGPERCFSEPPALCLSLLQEISRSHPTALFLENRLTMEAPFIELLSRLFQHDHRPVLVVAEHRTGEQSESAWNELQESLSRRRLLLEMQLGPLLTSDTRSLVSTLLGSGASDGLVQRVVKESGGNPFFVHELLGSLRETGSLTFKQGQWRLKSPETVPVAPPATGLASESRLAVISASQRRIMEVLATISRPVESGLLVDTLGDPEELVQRDLSDLKQLHLVSTQGTLAAPLFTLNHPWVASMIRGGMEEKVPGAIHRSLAMAWQKRAGLDSGWEEEVLHHYIEAGSAGEVDRRLAQVVRSLAERGLQGRASHLILRAMDLGLVNVADQKAVIPILEVLVHTSQFEHCLSLCRELLLRTDGTDPKERIQYLSLGGRSCLQLGLLEEARALLKEALALAEDLVESSMVQKLRAELIECSLGLSDRIETVRLRECLSRDLTLPSDLPQSTPADPAAAEAAYRSLALCDFEEGRVTDAAKWMSASIQSAIDRDPAAALESMSRLALFAIDRGFWSQADRWLESLAGEARARSDDFLLVRCLAGRTAIRRRTGRHRDAVTQLQDLLGDDSSDVGRRAGDLQLNLELARNWNSLFRPHDAMRCLQSYRTSLAEGGPASSHFEVELVWAWSRSLAGSVSEAQILLSHLDPEVLPRERSRYFGLQSRIALDLGLLEDAETAADRALQHAQDRPEERVQARLAGAEIMLAQGRLRAARRLLDEALQSSRTFFFAPHLARTLLNYARYWLAVRNLKQARLMCARACQLAGSIERPGLKAELYVLQGRVMAELGKTPEADRSFNQALQIYKTCLATLSPLDRVNFVERFISPLQRQRDSSMSAAATVSGPCLVKLREFFTAIRGSVTSRELGERLASLLRAIFPSHSVLVFMRESREEQMQLVASLGRCHCSGEQLLTQAGYQSEPFPVIQIRGNERGSMTAIAAPIRCWGELAGCLYLESRHGGLAEADLDFIRCLVAAFELVLERASSPGPTESGSRAAPRLLLSNGREIVARHPRMRKLFLDLARISASNATVLITGETGTGKEMIARAIHENSSRRRGPLVAINCSALPPELIETELFGYMPGSFTGASGVKRGLCEAAQGGTLFLDEIATMPLSLQVHLLRLLQNRTFRRIGDSRERQADLRVIAATNQPLPPLVAAGRFREDLYHRLNVCQLEIPPLRERAADIPLLAQHFVNRLNKEEKNPKTLAPEALALLSAHSFPGNVRELENMLESAFVLSEGRVIGAEQMAALIERGRRPATGQQARVRQILEQLVGERASFWEAVRDPFLQRDLSREEVRQVIAQGLSACGGSYRRLLTYFRLPQNSYKRFLAFLNNHDCKVDFRPFREAARHSEGSESR